MSSTTLPHLLVVVASSYLTLAIADTSLAGDVSGIYALCVFVLTIANLRKERHR